MPKIIGTDNFAREIIADQHLISFPDTVKDRGTASVFCDWLNEFTCNEITGGLYYKIVENDYRLSRGMEDLV